MSDKVHPATETVMDVAVPKYAPDGDVMVFLKNAAFRCNCGCNVFRHPDGDPSRYRCNSCGATYRGQ